LLLFGLDFFFLKFNPNDECLDLWDPINIIEFIIYRYIISDVSFGWYFFYFDLQPYIGRLQDVIPQSTFFFVHLSTKIFFFFVCNL
jgi:hypothetical protein